MKTILKFMVALTAVVILLGTVGFASKGDQPKPMITSGLYHKYGGGGGAWNFESLGIKPTFPATAVDIRSVLCSGAGQCTQIYFYNSTSKVWEKWDVSISDSLNEITNITDGYGFWVNATSPGLTNSFDGVYVDAITGEPAWSTMIPGWNNMMGWTNGTIYGMKISDAVSQIKTTWGKEIKRVWKFAGYSGITPKSFDLIEPYWPENPNALFNNSALSDGKAYWDCVEDASTVDYCKYNEPELMPWQNQRPTLETASPTVTPTMGEGGVTPFTFRIKYTDSDNDAPNPNYVVIDGTPHAMTATGSDYTAGVNFEYTTTLPYGEHKYYFNFSDGMNHVFYDGTNTTKYPKTVSYDATTTLNVSVGPLYVISKSPSHAETNVAPSTPVTVTFNLPVDKTKAQASFSLTSSSGTPVTGTFSWSPDGKTMTFTPSATLDGTYTALLTNHPSTVDAIKDTSGNYELSGSGYCGTVVAYEIPWMFTTKGYWPASIGSGDSLGTSGLARTMSLPTPVGPAATTDLITNGDFAAGMTSWTSSHMSNVPDTWSAGAGSGNLGLSRTNSMGDGGTIVAIQDVASGDVSAATNLVLNAKVYVDYHTLSGSGWWFDKYHGAGDYPAFIYVCYKDASGNNNQWSHGFLTGANPNSLTNYDTVTAKTWYSYSSTDLMALTPKPVNITRVILGGSGWDFSSAIDDITAMKTMSVGPGPGPDNTISTTGMSGSALARFKQAKTQPTQTQPTQVTGNAVSKFVSQKPVPALPKNSLAYINPVKAQPVKVQPVKTVVPANRTLAISTVRKFKVK